MTSAEATRRAHEECGCCGGIRKNDEGLYGIEECGGLHDAIDLAILAARVEQAEKACDLYVKNKQFERGGALQEERDRLRRELEEAAHGR